jgi:adhesin transport system membrane fusion protein
MSKLFKRVFYAVPSRLFDWLAGRAERDELHDDADFAQDANWTMAQQTPRGARLAVWLSLTAIAALLAWAAFAQLDEVTRGEGKVIPSRQLQVIQSLDGGIVSEILVREGQAVQPGQILLRIDRTRFVSSLRENRSQYLSLAAKAARLQAVADGKPFIPPPEVLKEVPLLAEQERMLYEARRAELEAGLGVARQQLTQRAQELNEVRARRDQAAQSYDLTNRELEVTRPLAKTGAVSDVELLRLERDLARYRGEREASNAQIPRIQASMSEAQRRAQEIELTFRNTARAELSETNAKLSQLTEGSVALADRVKQSDIRSPVRGTVKQLLVNTVGGVVQPGKDIVEVVPSDDALLLEARVAPKDIAFLRPGQKALVKFTAYDFAVYGGLEATVEHIGADTVTDDKGNAFYIVRVRTLATSVGIQKLPIIPGMIAEVDVLTGKKSILSYLMKPVLRAKSAAMTER